MKCRWCGKKVSVGHDCPRMPVDQKYEAVSYLEGIQAAANAGAGQHYVMFEPTRTVMRGPFVRLTLARAGDSLFSDSIIDQQEIQVSEGGLGYLNSKYGLLGVFETFDDLSAAQARFSAFLKEVTIYAIPSTPNGR